MFGWYYNKLTQTLNRYMDNEIISTIHFDDEEGYYVLFSRFVETEFFEDFEFVDAHRKDDGYMKLLILAEIYIRNHIKHNIGAFHLDSSSIEEDVDGFFKMD